jgi:hypothetical protein
MRAKMEGRRVWKAAKMADCARARHRAVLCADPLAASRRMDGREFMVRDARRCRAPHHEESLLGPALVILPVVPICRNPTALISPPNQRHFTPHPVPQEGRTRRHERWVRDAVDADATRDERRLRRTAKSCGPDTPTLVSSLRVKIRRRRWQKARSPRRARNKP